jgi:Uncharacterized protein family UPF0004/PPIC-type PPIASE domain
MLTIVALIAIVFIGGDNHFCGFNCNAFALLSSSSSTSTRRTSHAVQQQQRRQQPFFSTTKENNDIILSAASTSSSSSSSTSSSSTTAKAAATAAWFPTKIQQDIDYLNVVQSLYLRHIVVETTETAQLVMEQLLQNLSTHNYFATLATQLSACSHTKSDGGIIGWVDTTKMNNNNHKNETGGDGGDDLFSSSSSYYYINTVIPQDVLQTLVHQHQPKTGDIHVLYSPTTDQVHIVKVEELWLRRRNIYPLQQQQQLHQQRNNNSTTATARVGSHTGINAHIPRGRTQRFKGRGVAAATTLSSSSSSSFFANKSYILHTNGCQMNVADSERLEGILQHELQLHNKKAEVQDNTVADAEAEADIVIVNTCSIREHAQKKLYDLLGPYRARKRNGHPITIVVTGCVAQQEGLALLQSMPEVDVVVGPQYIPYLGQLLLQQQQQQQEDGGSHQLVVTEPMLIADNYNNNFNINNINDNNDNDDDDDDKNFFATTKPVRGHTVRAWVNAIYGCNEHCSYCV